MLHLAENIRWIRLLKGKKQTEFAVELGITADRLYSYEKGKAVPNEMIQAKIASMAGITTIELREKDIRDRSINVINPDTKKVEFTLAPNGANQHEKELEHLRELLKAEKEKNELLKQLIAKSSKKS